STSMLCGFQSGCGEVLSSDYAQVFGVPLALWGTIAFGVLFVLSLLPRIWIGRVFRILAVLAGLGGMGLLLLQILVIHRLCPFCLVVDLSALGLAILLVIPDSSCPLPAREGGPLFFW